MENDGKGFSEEGFKAALNYLKKDDPLRVQYEEAKCGLHILNAAVAQMNYHIDNIRQKIYDNWKL